MKIYLPLPTSKKKMDVVWEILLIFVGFLFALGCAICVCRWHYRREEDELYRVENALLLERKIRIQRS